MKRLAYFTVRVTSGFLLPHSFNKEAINIITMNSTVQTALDSVETALQTLIESVSTYNPSQTHAQELVDADIQLEETLEQRQYAPTPPLLRSFCFNSDYSL